MTKSPEYDGNPEYDAAIRRMEKAASSRKGYGWNARFVEAVRAEGYELIPYEKGTQFRRGDPIIAPIPVSGDVSSYPYPSVIARPGWKPTTIHPPIPLPPEPEDTP